MTAEQLARLAHIRDFSVGLYEELTAPEPIPEPEPPPPPPPRKVVTVTAGQNLQAAIDALGPDWTIELEAGTTWPTIRLATSPAAGPRTLKGQGITFRANRAQPALLTAPAAHDWRLEGDFTCHGDNGVQDVVRLGDGTGTQQTLESVPQRLWIDALSIQGHPTFQHRGLSWHAGETFIRRLTVRNIRRTDNGDTSGLAGWNGPGPLTVEHADIEAAGIGVLFGGADPAITGLIPSDITFGYLRVFKPLEWRNVYQAKNHFECKSARRVRVLGGEFVNGWKSAQDGYAIVLKSVNQNGNAPHSVVGDVSIERVKVVNCPGAVAVHPHPEAWRHPAQPANNLRFSHCHFDVSNRLGGQGWVVLMQGVRGVRFEHCTMLTNSGITIMADGSPNDEFVLRRSIVVDNAYGIKGAGKGEGKDTLAHYFPGAVVEENLFVTTSGWLYPAGNRIEAAMPADTTGYGASL